MADQDAYYTGTKFLSNTTMSLHSITGYIVYTTFMKATQEINPLYGIPKVEVIPFKGAITVYPS